MGKTFRKVKLSLAGQFTEEEKVKQWVEANGGKFSKDVNKEVTHLIATKVAFNKPHPAVRAAKRIKGIKIVTLEWLEESLLSKSRRPKREGPYLWSRLTKIARKKNRGTEKSSDGDAANQKKKPTMDLDGHHVYKDEAGSRYSAILIRPAPLIRPSSASSSREKHIIKLFESDGVAPHSYAVFVKFTRRGQSGSDFIAPPGSTWEEAYAKFNKFFKIKSGKNWARRHEKPERKRSKDGDELPVEEGWFEYQAEGTTAKAAMRPKQEKEEYDEAKAIVATTTMLQDAIRQMETDSGGSGESMDSPIDLEAIAAVGGPTDAKE